MNKYNPGQTSWDSSFLVVDRTAHLREKCTLQCCPYSKNSVPKTISGIGGGVGPHLRFSLRCKLCLSWPRLCTAQYCRQRGLDRNKPRSQGFCLIFALFPAIGLPRIDLGSEGLVFFRLYFSLDRCLRRWFVYIVM